MTISKHISFLFIIIFKVLFLEALCLMHIEIAKLAIKRSPWYFLDIPLKCNFSVLIPLSFPDPQPPVALPTSLSLSNPQQTAQITVSYPTPRSSHQQQTQPQKQRVFTGVVNKLHDTFGFVDEDVFFQLR